MSVYLSNIVLIWRDVNQCSSLRAVDGAFCSQTQHQSHYAKKPITPATGIPTHTINPPVPPILLCYIVNAHYPPLCPIAPLTHQTPRTTHTPLPHPDLLP